ncbi:MAG: hypothetical protein WKF33_04685 [Thermoleophilaceae bacterium]
MRSQPRFLQGAFPFSGAGLEHPSALDGGLSYKVPADRRAQLVYFRGGNSADELICVSLIRDGEPMRLFPLGARSDTHVPLRVVEDLLPGTEIEIHLAAPEGTSGTAIVDVGLVES